ncbi:MAG: 50S ribosomal protein L11 methyltransferase [Candidatus Berkiella sp.]
MSFVEVSFEVPEKTTDACSELLEKLGALAVSYFDGANEPLLEPLPGTTPLWNKVKVVGLFEAGADLSHLRKTLFDFLPDLSLQVSTLADQEWSRVWLEHFKPMRFGDNFWVAPHEHPEVTALEKEAIVLKLDPGLAFGTGTHPTTALCLEWLSNHAPKGQYVIDYGCGSGILGIGALLLGAKHVDAIDYDPQALISTQDNAQRNNLISEQIAVYRPEDFKAEQPAKTVLANILAEPLIELAPRLRLLTEIGGHLVLSGLLTNQAEMVKAAYRDWFSFEPVKSVDDWALLVGVRIA